MPERTGFTEQKKGLVFILSFLFLFKLIVSAPASMPTSEAFLLHHLSQPHQRSILHLGLTTRGQHGKVQNIGRLLSEEDPALPPRFFHSDHSDACSHLA